MTNRGLWSSLLVLSLVLPACAGHDDPMTEAPAAGASGSAGSAAGSSTAGVGGGAGVSGGASGGAGSSGSAGKAGPVEPGQAAPLRLVNLLAGASSLSVALGGEPTWSNLSWPGVTAVASMPSGLGLVASAGGLTLLETTPSLDPAVTTQVALIGLANGAHKALSLPPSESNGPRVRIVHATPHLHDGAFRVYSSGLYQNNSSSLAFGGVSDWVEMTGATSSWSLSISTDNRSGYFSFDTPIKGPTTLYVATSTEEDLFVYAVADDGTALQNGPPPSGARVRFSHLAAGLPATSFTVDDTLVGGLSTSVAWSEMTDVALIKPHLATLKAVSPDGAVIASIEQDLRNFAQMSFVLVGGPQDATLLPIMEGWAHLNDPGEKISRVRLVDARPGSGHIGVSTWYDNWTQSAWEPLLGSLAPRVLTGPLEVPAQSLLLGLDLDQDGTNDLRFPVGTPTYGSRTTLIFAPEADGTPWVWVGEPEAPFRRVAAAERTAHVRLWNLRDQPLAFSTPTAAPLWGDWPSPAEPGMATYTATTLSGARWFDIGEQSAEVALDPMTDTTLVALPGGELLELQAPTQIDTRARSVQLVNTSGEQVSVTLSDGTSLGAALAPGKATAAALLPPEETASTITIQRANQAPLSFVIPGIYQGGTTVLAYGGDPTWPEIRVLQASSPSTEVVHAEELSARLRVVAVMNESHDVDLYLDDQPDAYTNTWPQWSSEPTVAFGVASPVVVPAGYHKVRLGKNDPAIEVEVTLEAGTTSTLLLLPDLTTRIVPQPADPTEVITINTALGAETTQVLMTDSKGDSKGVLAADIPFGQWVNTPYPGDHRYANADWNLDGKPDWRSYLPVLSGSVVLVVGTATEQAVVCVQGGWAGVVGHKVK